MGKSWCLLQLARSIACKLEIPNEVGNSNCPSSGAPGSLTHIGIDGVRAFFGVQRGERAVPVVRMAFLRRSSVCGSLLMCYLCIQLNTVRTQDSCLVTLHARGMPRYPRSP